MCFSRESYVPESFLIQPGHYKLLHKQYEFIFYWLEIPCYTSELTFILQTVNWFSIACVSPYTHKDSWKIHLLFYIFSYLLLMPLFFSYFLSDLWTKTLMLEVEIFFPLAFIHINLFFTLWLFLPYPRLLKYVHICVDGLFH